MTTRTQPRVVLARVLDEPLDLAEHVAAVTSPAHGAADVFVGMVRDSDPGAVGEVVLLEYEAHPDAGTILSGLAARVSQETGATIAVSHRSGTLRVGDVAVVIASAAPHRAAALAATRHLIELVKTDLPIWKRQSDDTGASAWVGLT